MRLSESFHFEALLLLLLLLLEMLLLLPSEKAVTATAACAGKDFTHLLLRFSVESSAEEQAGVLRQRAEDEEDASQHPAYERIIGNTIFST